jgi:PAS domain S-box-containing protein
MAALDTAGLDKRLFRQINCHDVTSYQAGGGRCPGERMATIGQGKIEPGLSTTGEETLRESEEKFSKFFHATPAILGVSTLAEGIFVDVNEAFERFFGYGREEVIGRSSHDLGIWENPSDRTGVIKTLQESGKVRDLGAKFRDRAGKPLVGIYSAEIIEIKGEQYLLSQVTDITARKRMEEALRKSEERFRHLYYDTPAMLHSIDQEGRLVSVSDYWLEVLGYERNEVLGWKSTEFLTEASRRYADEVVLPAYFKTGFCKDVPYQIVTKSGKMLDVLLSATAELNDAGEIVRSLAIMTDVTERKRAEEALRESEEKFSRAFHATPTLLVISILADGKYIEVNEAFERLLGYSREEAIGRTSIELGIWENQADRARYVQALRDKGKVRDMEINLRSKTGEIIVGLFSGEIIEVGGETRLLTLVNDITARKRAEEALKASEERYRRIVDTSQEGILAVDAEARLTYVNQRLAEMLGHDGAGMLGRSYLEFIDHSRSGEVAERLRRRKEGVREQYETVFVRSDGGKMWGSVSATPIMGVRGEFCGSFAMVSDVSEQKRFKEEIEVLNTNLVARALALELANEELEAFGYTVSHDLRKPLTAISGYSQLILEQFGAGLNVDCRNYFQEIVNGAGRMNQLIDTLLDFSRLTRRELHRETVDLSAMTHAVIAELSLADPQRRVSCIIAEGTVVNGDAKLLRVVMDNLLGNAWKYTAKTEEAVIEFGVMEHRGKTVCFVRDNGVGFDMAHANRLFAVFQRLHSTSEFEGIGIGLATVQRIVQCHGGRVWAEAECGKGATFYFTLGQQPTIDSPFQ